MPSSCSLHTASALLLSLACCLTGCSRAGVVSTLLKSSLQDGKLTKSGPVPPRFPRVYTAKYNVTMPHLYLTQPQGLTFPVSVWYDGTNSRMRVEVLGGLDTVITLQDVEYTIFPRINVTECGVFTHGPVKGAGNDADDLDSVLPDLTGWDYGGEIQLDGKQAHIWQYQRKEEEKVSQYTFYTGPAGEPLKFLMVGINYLTGGHFDEYIYEFTSFQPKLVWPDSEAPSSTGGAGDAPFVPPQICDLQTSPTARRLTARHPVAHQIHASTPRVRGYDYESAYHAFSRMAHAPEERPHVHDHSLRLAARLQAFRSNAERVRAHNANPDKSYTQRLGRWADWTDDEFHAVMLPNKARKEQLKLQGLKPQSVAKVPDAYKPLGRFKRRLPDSRLPRLVDWRGTGADPGVKDQGMCGSCFAFSATGSMEGVWYVSTGQHRSFSEQQIIDCSWDYGPSGCGGGDYQPVFNYVAKEGGVALEQEYPYVSNNDFCKAANKTRPGAFKGFLEIPSRDEGALMEAVFTLGPIAVAVDAEFNSFRSYSEGVYDEPDCATESADLDHAVVLFGYGTQGDLHERASRQQVICGGPAELVFCVPRIVPGWTCQQLNTPCQKGYLPAHLRILARVTETGSRTASN